MKTPLSFLGIAALSLFGFLDVTGRAALQVTDIDPYVFSQNLVATVSDVTDVIEVSDVTDFFIQQAHAQSTTKLWFQTIGTTANDVGYDVLRTRDGGFIVVGKSAGFGGGKNILILKFDQNAQLQWARAVKGSAARGVRQTSDDGFVVAAESFYVGAGGYDVLLMKYDQFGSLQWAKATGTSTDELVKGFDMVPGGNDGFILVGTTSGVPTNAMIIRYDANGNVTWAKKAGGSANDEYRHVQAMSNSEFIVTGLTVSFNGHQNSSADALVVRYNGSGGVTLAKAVGGVGVDYGQAITKDSSNNLILTGVSRSHPDNGFGDVLLYKLSPSGSMIWARLVGWNSIDIGQDVLQNNEGNYVVAAVIRDGNDDKLMLVKYDPNGNRLWNPSTPISAWTVEQVSSFGQTQDGGYVITGSTEALGAVGDDVFLLKTDSEGKTPGFGSNTRMSFGTPHNDNVNLADVKVTDIAGSINSQNLNQAHAAVTLSALSSTAVSPGVDMEDSENLPPATDCAPPLAGDWFVTYDCTLQSNYTSNGNIIVDDGVGLTIADGVTLTIDFDTYHLRIKQGAKVVIKPNAKIDEPI